MAPARLHVVGCHGGSGESRLASVIEGAASTGHAWPIPASAASCSILVARTDLSGLLAAQAAARQWSEGGAGPSVLLGLVLMADQPGRLPKELAQFASVIQGGVPRVWRFPFVDQWRTRPAAAATALPHDARRTTHQIDQLINNMTGKDA